MLCYFGFLRWRCEPQSVPAGDGQILLGKLHQACTGSLVPSVRMLHPGLITAKLGVALNLRGRQHLDG